MPEYPPDDQARARADAARALTDALRAVADANERLQFAAAWVLDELVETPASVPSDVSGPEDRGRADALCATEDCGHRRDAHSYDLWECDLCSCGAFL
jgi:hypothetical protein